MEIVLSKDSFLDALGRTQGIVERRTVTPALSHIYLKANESGSVTMDATDMDLSLRTGLEGEVTTPGEAVISARKALEIVKELGDQTLTLKVGDPRFLTLAAGKSNFRLVCLPAADFPPMPEMEADRTVTMGSAVLQEVIRKTAFAASQEESRYAINGVLFEIESAREGAQVTAVGTDGHRLALYRPPAGGAAPSGTIKCLIPRRTLQECRRLFPPEGSDVSIGVGEKGISFSGQGTVLMSRIIQGQFPDYQGVIRVESGNRAVVEREPFAHAIRRVSVMGDDKVRQVRLDFSANAVRISSSHPDMGEAVEEMSLEYDGAELTLAFNALYLIEGLRAVDDESVTLTLAGDFKPCLLRGEKDGDFAYVVMPMRI